MIKKSKGSFIFELIIVILIVVLIWAILYPKKVWEKQENLQSICRSRLEALQQYEYQYYSNYRTYSDSIPKLIQNVLDDSTALARLDSVLQWDTITEKDKLKDFVMQKNLPEDLRNLILTRLESGLSLHNLSKWDSLQYKLVYELQEYISSPDSVRDDEVINESVEWRELLSRNKIINILEEQATSTFMRRYSVREFRRNKDLTGTRYWDQYAPYFQEELKTTVNYALKQDIWTGEEGKDRDSWEQATRPRWTEQFDTLSQTKKDSIIDEQKKVLWGNRKELRWKEDRKRLWRKEGEEWLEENSEVWKRILDKRWRLERKKEWLENKLTEVPDTLQESFKAQKDSLWKTIVDSLKEEEYQEWLAHNADYVDDVKKDLFESDRRLTWEDEAYQEWIAEKEQNREEFWKQIKELMWKKEKDILWEKEQEKLKKKDSALKKLNDSVKWINIFGNEKIVNMVNNLDLPDSKELWNCIVNADPETHSALYDLGVVALFSDSLLTSVKSCPVANEAYLVSYIDTTTPPEFEIKCPIIDTEKTARIMIIDPVTNDTSYKKLRVPFIEKIFGGREIKNHGTVDHSKKSWEE
ncbi:MAG: hypothetical protein R6V04_01700 [bacterium]